MARKIATIGITINLENYENLRLEVQGEIGADGDTEELIAFLDGMLARLGHGDEATGELVDAYRRRVIAPPGTGTAPSRAAARPSPARKEAGAASGTVAQPGSPPPPRSTAGPVPEAAAPKPLQEEPAPQEKPATTRVSPEARPVKPAARPAARPEAAAPPPPVQEPVLRKAPPAQPPRETPEEPAPVEQAPKAVKPKIAEGEVACEACGASITRNQEKLSKLLTGKTLCKKCMNP
jgi:hypothetical protein